VHWVRGMSWQRLQDELGATLDKRGWLKVTVGGREFTLMQASLGRSAVVVANSVIGPEQHVRCRDAAMAASSWPIGSVVLYDGSWVLRHTFVGVPAGGLLLDVLRCLLIQARTLLSRPPVANGGPALAHYAE
jgi:hypothetical protein